MADEELELDVTQPKGNKKLTIIIIVLVVLVLLLGGAAAWLFLSQSDESANEAGNTEVAEEEKLPLNYLSLVPEFVVNFGPNQRVRYLQIELQVSSRDPGALKMVSTYMPIIRNDILVEISSKTYDELKTREGKEKLQMKLLNTINRVLTTVSKPKEVEAAGEESTETETPVEPPVDPDAIIPGPIENVYYQSFIMQ